MNCVKWSVGAKRPSWGSRAPGAPGDLVAVEPDHARDNFWCPLVELAGPRLGTTYSIVYCL